MAYGLRGFNLYMAVGRDRWVGAPIDARGKPRALQAHYARILGAIERTKLNTLRRRAPVRLVVPRSLRRLARTTHAFGPLTPALFHVLGAGWRESVLERDFGQGAPSAIAAEAYLRAFERALHARGVPFAHAGGDRVEPYTSGASWIVCASAGRLTHDFVDSLHAARKAGIVVTIGPSAPELEGNSQGPERRTEAPGFEIERLEDLAQADALVARRIDELDLPTWPVDPTEAHVCVHEDEHGTPHVVFVLNPTPTDVVTRASLAGVDALVDAIGEGRIARSGGAFEVPVPARAVRMMVVERA
jgi:beta-galactosidase